MRVKEEFLKHLGECVRIHTHFLHRQLIGRVKRVFENEVTIILLNNLLEVISFNDIVCVYWLEGR